MPRRGRKLFGCVAFTFSLAAAGPAAAHGFGQRYDLPIPLSFYIWGAGATVALSFVGFGLFLRAEHGFPDWHIDWQGKGRLLGALAAVPRALASGMLLLVIVAGLFGNQDPIRNIAPVMIWIIGWVGTGVLVCAARRCLEAGQSLECGFRACRALLSPRARGRGSWFRAALSGIAGGVARLPAARGVRLDGARMERQERPCRTRGRARRLFRADVFRHGPVRTTEMARARGDVHARLRHLCTVRPAGSHTAAAGHPRADAGGRIAGRAACDILDGRAGGCAAGDRHLRRTARNATLGAGRCRGPGLGLRTVIRARADPARRPDGAAGSQRGARGIRFAVSGGLRGRVPVDGGRCGRARRADRRRASQLRAHARADRDRLSRGALFLVVLPRRAIRHSAAVGSAGPRLESLRDRPLSGGYRAGHATAAVERRGGRGGAGPCVRNLPLARYGASPLRRSACGAEESDPDGRAD